METSSFFFPHPIAVMVKTAAISHNGAVSSRPRRFGSPRSGDLFHTLRVLAAAKPGRIIVIVERMRGRLIGAAVAVLGRVHVIAAAERSAARSRTVPAVVDP